MNVVATALDSQPGSDVEQTIRHHLVEVAGAVQHLIHGQRLHDAEVAGLRADLELANRGFRSLREEMIEKEKSWERERLLLQARIASFENSERRVVCLVDGDGTIFSRDLLAQGSQGGQAAARELSRHIHAYLDNTFQMPPSTYTLSIFVFLHKKGLMEALGRAGYTAEKSNFDDFLAGFNQAGQRFVMVDVGAGKENADSKLKVFLHDNARSPQTVKILFGASHDNGYTPDLKSLISEGYSKKLILLPGYTEVASSIRELELDTLIIPDLFLPDKLTILRTPKFNNATLPDVFSNDTGNAKAPGTPGVARRNSVSAAATVPLPTTPGPPGRRLSRAARKRSKSNNVSEAESVSGDSASSPPENIVVLSPATLVPPTTPPAVPAAAISNGLVIAPHLLLRGRFDPIPCQKYYLLGSCPFRSSCKFGHTYVLTPDDMRDLADSAKGIPCKEVTKGRQCAMNDRCIYGHKCPFGPTCLHLARGACHFKLPGMHEL